MTTTLLNSALDIVLALQFTVAWAGEARCEPERLGWWETDLIDEAGGGDFMQRLLPKTHAWAALEAVREAARRVDAEARANSPTAATLRTLFYLGFEVDEQINARSRVLKGSGARPASVLTLPLPLGAEFDPGRLTTVLAPEGAVSFESGPLGRRLGKVAHETPAQMAQQLAAALTPLSETYPMPYYEVS